AQTFQAERIVAPGVPASYGKLLSRNRSHPGPVDVPIARIGRAIVCGDYRSTAVASAHNLECWHLPTWAIRAKRRSSCAYGAISGARRCECRLREPCDRQRSEGKNLRPEVSALVHNLAL